MAAIRQWQHPVWRIGAPGALWIFRSLLLLCVVALFSACCAAQDFPRWELSGAYEYDIIGRIPGRSITITDHGPQAGLAYSINRWFRVAGQFETGFSRRIMDLSVAPPGYRHYNNKLLLGLVGPELVFRRPDHKLQPFAHYLTGVAYAIDIQVPTAGSSTGAFPPALTATRWTNDVGSGVDLRLGHQVSVRTLEVDFMRTGFANNPHSNWRFSTGFVLRLGGGK